MASFGAWFGGWFAPADAHGGSLPSAAGASSSSSSTAGGAASATAAGAAGGGGDRGGQGQTFAANVAAAVKRSGDDRLVAAWQGLRKELEVLQQIWASKALVEEKNPLTSTWSTSSSQQAAKRRELQGAIQTALLSSEVDPLGSAALLQPLLQKGTHNEALNHASETAMREVVKAEKHAQLCQRLASKLQAAGAAGVGGAMAGAAAGQEDLESLVVACHLKGDVESRARRVLGMAPSKEEVARAARQEKAAKAQAAQAKVKQVAEVSKTSQEKAKAALESAGGDAELALIMLLSEEDARGAKKAAQQQESRQAVEAATKARAAEAGELAGKVSTLAALTHRMAWSRVQAELEVQVSIWNTSALQSTAVGGVSFSYGEAQQELEGVLQVAQGDPAGAVLLLETVLQKVATEEGLELCGGMLLAADAVLDAERLSRNRRELANSLEACARSLEAGVAPKCTPGQRRELDDLVVSCGLGATDLAGRVQRVLDDRKLSSKIAEERRVSL